MVALTDKHRTLTPSVLLFGEPFTGKSLLAGELAEHFNILYIDLESGSDVLFQLNPEWQKRVDVVAIPDSSFYPIAIETVLKLIKGPVDICDTHGKVSCLICKRSEGLLTHVDVNALAADTIVIYDSATQLTASAIAHITKGQPDDYKLDYDDWGALKQLMEIFFSHIQTARYNRIIISHVTEAEQEDKKKKLYPVSGSRNFSAQVAKYFDHVIYLEKKNKKHCAASATTYMNNIMTGSRTNVKMEEMERASLLPIFKPSKDNPPVTRTISPTVNNKLAGTKSTSDLLTQLKVKMNTKK